MNRRGFLKAGFFGATTALHSPITHTSAQQGDPAGGRLRARPGGPSSSEWTPGEHRLGLAPRRDGFAYVPVRHDDAAGAPLIVLLHGAGQRALMWRDLFSLADSLGCVLLAPDARERTWDRVLGRFGADVAFIDRALTSLFARCAIDPARIAFAGFSDGASYALTLGLTNGDLVTDIIALSPGFMDPPSLRGKPRIFIAHGRQDRILPIATTSRRIAPRLQELGYLVTSVEFEGGHRIERTIVDRAFSAFAANR